VAKNGSSAQACSVSKAVAVAADPPTSYADRDLGGTVPVINMNSLICGPALCPAVVGNVLVYMDSHHLTQSYAQTLTPYLHDKLKVALPKALPAGKQSALS
jgi:hypothetical protein